MTQKQMHQTAFRDTGISKSPPASPWMTGLAVIVLVVFGVLVYSNTFHSPFVFDDINFITKNDPHVHMTTFSWANLKEAALKGKPHGRIMPHISFAINYYFGDENPWGYHLVNLIIHLLTGIFLFLLARITLSLSAANATFHDPTDSSAVSHARTLVSFFAALLWLVHPVETNAVTYICQRMTSMAALFYILSMVLYVKGRLQVAAKRSKSAVGFFAGCVLAGACALATKENTGTLPLFILLYEWFFFQNLKDIRQTRALPWLLFGLVVFAGIGLIYLGENPIHRIIASYSRRNFTLPQRVFTEFRVIAYYLSLIAFPYPGRLILDHDYPISNALFHPPTTAASLVMIIALVAIAVYTAKKQRLFAFCILWFLGNLVIESSVIGIEIIYEHRLYLPSMMIFLLISVWMFKKIRVKRVAAGVLTTTAILLAVWAHQRNEIWQSNVAFWTDSAAKSPRKARPYQNLAYSYQMDGNFSEAIINYRKSIRIKPHPVVWYNLGIALAYEKKDFEAAGAYVNALKMGYNTAQVHMNLSQALSNIGESQSALKHFRQAAAMSPPEPSTMRKIDETEKFLKNCGNPIACVKQLINRSPDNPALSYKLATLYERQGALQQAIPAYENVLKKTNLSGDRLALLAINRLGNIYIAGGQTGKALETFRQGLRQAPASPLFYYQIARVYAGRHDQKRAIGWLDQAIGRGFADWQQFRSDESWAFIRETPYYQKLKTKF